MTSAVSEDNSAAGTSPAAALLDSLPIRFSQILIVAIVMIALASDGIGIQLLAYVAPVVIKEWSLSKAALGPAMAAALIGMAVGASAGGWLGDRIGPKRTFALSVLLFGGTTAITGMSWDLMSMIVLRFISGIGLGAAGPSGVALAVDWVPTRAKPKAVALIAITAPLGGALGAALVSWMLPLWGWRGVFTASGVATVLLTVVMLVLLPESWTFLAKLRRTVPAQALLFKVVQHRFDESELQVRENGPANAPLSILVTHYGRLLAGAGCTYFCLQFVAFATLAWTPVFLTMKAFTLPQALAADFASHVGGMAGVLSAPFILTWLGSRTLLIGGNALVFGCVMTIAILLGTHGQYPPSVTEALIVQIVYGIMGVIIGSMITTLWTLLANSLPAEYRATGLGFGMMMGRLGCILIVLIGGILISLETQYLSFLFGAMLILGLGAIFSSLIIDRHMPRQRARIADTHLREVGAMRSARRPRSDSA